MGLIFSRFRKAGDSPSTKLDAINKELAEIEAYRRQNLARQKKAVASLVIYSILVYLVCAILYFVYYFPVLTLKHKLLHSLPLLIFPVLIYGVKKFLHWYFVKRITENDIKLADLKEEKNKIIEDVMENETYKKATEILEKYAPNRLRTLNQSKDSSSLCSPEAVQSSRVQSPIPGSELRLRANTAPLNMSMAVPGASTPVAGGLNSTMAGQTPRPMNTPGSKMTMQQRSLYGAPPGPPLPRQVLPRDRSYMDKLFESLVGDGPQNRYALICRYCQSHNGMALSEEFEFLGFRCCYCFHMNEARKRRPNAPRLNLDTTIGTTSDEDEAEPLTEDDLQGSEESESEAVDGPVVETQTIGEPTESAANHLHATGSDIPQPTDNGDKKDN